MPGQGAGAVVQAVQVISGISIKFWNSSAKDFGSAFTVSIITLEIVSKVYSPHILQHLVDKSHHLKVALVACVARALR